LKQQFGLYTFDCLRGQKKDKNNSHLLALAVQSEGIKLETLIEEYLAYSQTEQVPHSGSM
jgi:hypothetical protein